MELVFWYVLGAALVFFVVIFVGNIYFLASYAHPNDTPFGKSILMRIVVVCNSLINQSRSLDIQSATCPFC